MLLSYLPPFRSVQSLVASVTEVLATIPDQIIRPNRFGPLSRIQKEVGLMLWLVTSLGRCPRISVLIYE